MPNRHSYDHASVMALYLAESMECLENLEQNGSSSAAFSVAFQVFAESLL